MNAGTTLRERTRRGLMHALSAPVAPVLIAPDREVRVRRWLLALFAVTVVAVTIQRGVLPHAHWTFPVFRASYDHLVAGRDLYARYTQHDLFKYSPTFALLFAPFALPPFAIGLFAWDALNAVALCYALTRLLPREHATLAIALVYPEYLISAQASQSNALIAGLIMLAFVSMEKRRHLGAALAIALGAITKIFPLAALSFAVFDGRRARFALVFAVTLVALLVLPLVVLSPGALAAQYTSWHAIEMIDALDRGASVMGLLQHVFSGSWPNWPVQVAGTLVLLVPLVRFRSRWNDPHFQRLYLCSLLVYVVLFNHQAERPSFVIAAAGVAVWYAIGPRTLFRSALVALSLVGLKAAPYLIIWLVMQGELLGLRVTDRSESLATAAS